MTMATPDLKALAERPARTMNEDGLTELVIGALWILIAGSLLAGTGLRPGPIRTTFWIVIPVVFMIVAVYMTIWGLKRIRERITYPRTGYVNSLTPRSAWIGLVVVMLVGAGILILGFAGTGDRLMNLIPAVGGLLIAAGFVVLAIRRKNLSLLILSGPALVVAIGIPFLHVGENSFLWLWLWLGTASAATGAFRLRIFLRRHPRNRETEA
jgi:LPXTG-motif cell wall-anchored protein